MKNLSFKELATISRNRVMNGHKFAISSASILHLHISTMFELNSAAHECKHTRIIGSLERVKIRRLMDLSFVLYENSVTSLVYEK